MLLKGLTEKLSPLIQDLKKESIKSTPFNTESHTQTEHGKGSVIVRRGFCELIFLHLHIPSAVTIWGWGRSRQVH